MSDNMSDNKQADWRAELRARHPNLLRRAWDFGVGDGWRGVLERLFAAMEAAVPAEARGDFYVSQIKEKFAGLRVHHNGDEAVEALVEAAEEEASRTCDVCGAAGDRKNADGFVAVRCEDHHPSRGVF